MPCVPFLDLHAQYHSIRAEISEAIQRVLEDSAFTSGPYVEKFEREFADFCGANHAVATSNGTSALWMTLLAAGVAPGDEVITAPNTFIATAEAISFAGAQPVFVDVDQRSYTMVPELLQKAITPRTKAIIPIHLFGQPANMDPIMEIATKHNILVIEDACQAHGALYRSRPAGTLGIAGCFSFYPGKNLGAYGEAGAVVTNDSVLAEKVRKLRDHGQLRKYHHTVIGWNGRMDGIQGAILSVKLKYLSRWNEARRAIAAEYNRLLGGLSEIILPSEMEYARHVYHIFAIRTKNRDALSSHLADKGITCLIHYPVPVHLQEAYRHLDLQPGTFPIAEQCATELLSLPMFPEMTSAQIESVTTGIKDFFAGAGCRM